MYLSAAHFSSTAKDPILCWGPWLGLVSFFCAENARRKSASRSLSIFVLPVSTECLGVFLRTSVGLSLKHLKKCSSFERESGREHWLSRDVDGVGAGVAALPCGSAQTVDGCAWCWAGCFTIAGGVARFSYCIRWEVGQQNCTVHTERQKQKHRSVSGESDAK